jgi:hypothetical protein
MRDLVQNSEGETYRVVARLKPELDSKNVVRPEPALRYGDALVHSSTGYGCVSLTAGRGAP